MSLPVLHSIVDRVRTSHRAALAFDRVGLATLADRLDAIREGGDLVAIPLPIGPGQLRAHRIKLFRHGGNDHAVEGIVLGGWFGFERPLPDVLLRTARHYGGVVIDVGANSGFYALLAAEARRDVVVHAFEPFPPVAEVLRRNIGSNHSGARVHVHPLAVAETDGELTLYIPRGSDAIETSASLDPTFKDDVTDEVKTATVTLDRFWADAGRPTVTMMKIDTEGSEDRVLAGAAALVAGTRPVIFCEVLPRADMDAIDAFCRDQRYVRTRLQPGAAVVTSHVEWDPDAWNHCFVAAERFHEFADRVLAPLLPVLDERA